MSAFQLQAVSVSVAVSKRLVSFGHSSRPRENGDSQTEADKSRGCEPHRFLLSLASSLIIIFQKRSWAKYVLLAI